MNQTQLDDECDAEEDFTQSVGHSLFVNASGFFCLT
jgi:hypothetical protein